MAKGFKDSKGKFRPTSSSSGLKSKQVGLSESERNTLFAKTNSIGFSVSKAQRRRINGKLFMDNIKKAKAKAKRNETTTVLTNPSMETFVFAHEVNSKGSIKKNGLTRTLAFVGHKNDANPSDVRVVPAREIGEAD